MPRPELASIGLNVNCGLQKIDAKSHPDLRVDSTLREARITNVRVTRPDPDVPRLSLSFVLSLSMDRRDTLVWVVQAFARVNYLTFFDEQRDIFEDEAQGVRDAVQRFHDVNARNGMTTTITAGGRSVTLGPKDKAATSTACTHGVDITADSCEACEADAKRDTAAAVGDLAARERFVADAGGGASPADIQAAGARKGRERRATTKAASGRGWRAALRGRK